MKTKLLFLSSFIALALNANAQWLDAAAGFPTASRGINDYIITSDGGIWAPAYDGSGGSGIIQEFTRSVDGGLTWKADTVDVGATLAAEIEIANICAIDSMTAWALMYDADQTVAGGVWKTTDGGVNWAQQTTAAYGVSSFPDIVYFWDANTGVTMGDPLGADFEIYTTIDGGTTWNVVSVDSIPNAISGEYGIVNLFSANSGIIWFGTNKGRVFKSTNMGQSWTVATTGLAEITKLEFKDANFGIAKRNVVTSNKLSSVQYRKTTDGGLTWSSYTPSGKMYHSDFCFVPGTASTWVSTGAYTSTSATTAITALSGSSYSTDDGATWIDLEPGGTIQRTAVKFANMQKGFAGGFSQDQFTGGIYIWDTAYFNTITVKKTITAANNTLNVSVYPNPNNGTFTMTMTGFEQKKVALNVYNLIGEKVYTEEMNLYAANYSKQISLGSLPSGVYMVQVTDGNNTFTHKITVK